MSKGINKSLLEGAKTAKEECDWIGSLSDFASKRIKMLPMSKE